MVTTKMSRVEVIREHKVAERAESASPKRILRVAERLFLKKGYISAASRNCSPVS
jgi:hypothetical protein